MSVGWKAAATALVLLSLLPGPAHAGAPTASAGGRFDGLLDTLDAARQAGSVPAMAVVVLSDGRPTVVAGLGTAGPDTPFRWGSITKSFTALAALTLVRDGRVGLDAPIRPILGEGYYENTWAATQPVRLLHLLTLSAGFGDLSRTEWDDNTPLPLWTALARYAPQRVVRWPPGLQHSYSNATPGLTAAVIEKLSGRTFEAFLADRVFAPLGMTGATLSPRPDLPGGYQADGRTPIPYWHMTYPAFGALNASARDMSRYLGALLNDGRVADAAGLPADLLRGFLTPAGTLGAAAGLAVGYGPGTYGWVHGGHVFVGHGGDADGYRSRYAVLPEHGRGYALVINTDNPRLLRRLQRLVETALTEDLPAHPPLPRSTEDLSVYTGVYYPSSSRFDRREVVRARVEVAGDAVHFQRAGATTPLYPVGGGRFVRSGDPAVTVVFVRMGASLYLQGELGNFVNLSRGSCPDFLGGCE